MRGNRQTRDRSVWLGVTVALVLGILCGGSMDISRSYAAEGIGSRQEAVRKNAGAAAWHQELYYSSGGIFRVSGTELWKGTAGEQTAAPVEGSPPAEMAGSVTEPVGTVTPAGETEPPKESVQPGHTAGPKNSIKPKPTVTPVPGRLVHKKYTTRYVYKGGKKLKKSFLTLKKKTYYFDKNGWIIPSSPVAIS